MGDVSLSSSSPIVVKRASQRAGRIETSVNLPNLVQAQLAQDKQRMEEELEYREMQREMWEQDRLDHIAAEKARREREEAKRMEHREHEDAERAGRSEREDRQHRLFMQMIGLMFVRKE